MCMHCHHLVPSKRAKLSLSFFLYLRAGLVRRDHRKVQRPHRHLHDQAQKGRNTPFDALVLSVFTETCHAYRGNSYAAEWETIDEPGRGAEGDFGRLLASQGQRQGGGGGAQGDGDAKRA